jgi:signal transduction histidine kinase
VAAPGPAAPPRWWQHPVRRWLLEAWIQVVCLFSMTAALAAASDASGAPDGTIPPGYMLAWLVAVPAGATVSLRRSRPVLSVLVTGLAAVLLPIDALAVLIALPWVIARRPPRVAWACGALAALAVTASQWRDAARRPDHALFSTLDKATGETLNMGVQGFVIVGAVLLAVSVAWGLLRRSREAAAAAARSEREQAQQVAVLRAELTTELTRQDERDLIARELHDTVAHHLSVVSLRASALEVSAGDDGVQDAARSMRASAHQALEEMRDLIAVLRDAQVPLTPGPMPGRTLADLPELVATARDGGADIAATVFVTDGAAAPATLTRAVYRIVQEALTNALKHAPYARVDLDVRAAPGDGVHLRVRNALATEAADAAGVPGSGTGIVGMRERAATVGGTVEAGRDGGTWQVVAHLPWPAQGGPTIEG